MLSGIIVMVIMSRTDGVYYPCRNTRLESRRLSWEIRLVCRYRLRSAFVFVRACVNVCVCVFVWAVCVLFSLTVKIWELNQTSLENARTGSCLSQDVTDVVTSLSRKSGGQSFPLVADLIQNHKLGEKKKVWKRFIVFTPTNDFWFVLIIILTHDTFFCLCPCFARWNFDRELERAGALSMVFTV